MRNKMGPTLFPGVRQAKQKSRMKNVPAGLLAGIDLLKNV